MNERPGCPEQGLRSYPLNLIRVMPAKGTGICTRPGRPGRFFLVMAEAKGRDAMKITVNGKAHEHRGDGTVAGVLRELGADPARVAVVVNEAVIRSAERAAARLKEGDRVEVLTFAGGG